MKKVISISAICCLALSLEACGPSKQASEEVNTTEKEVFTVEESRADTSAPLPNDSVWTVESTPEIPKGENTILTTRKKSVDAQEAPLPAEGKKAVNSTPASQEKVLMAEKNPEMKKETVPGKNEKYFVQLGAFQSEENAREFMRESSRKLKADLQIKYSEKINCYLVRLPGCDTKGEALNVVKELKKKGFSDVFIVQSVE